MYHKIQKVPKKYKKATKSNKIYQNVPKIPTLYLHVCSTVKFVHLPSYRTFICHCYQNVARNEADAVKKCHVERAPSRWPSPLTFKAAPQSSLYTNPVYRIHLCQCSQKVARNQADAIKKCHIE